MCQVCRQLIIQVCARFASPSISRSLSLLKLGLVIFVVLGKEKRTTLGSTRQEKIYLQKRERAGPHKSLPIEFRLHEGEAQLNCWWLARSALLLVCAEFVAAKRQC